MTKLSGVSLEGDYLKLTCNGKSVIVTDEMHVCHSNFICSTVGGNDLVDMGFTFNDVRDHDMLVEIGDVRIVFECEKTHRDRLVARLVKEQKVSKSSAEYLLAKHGWHYGITVQDIRMRRNTKGELKPCGEIPLSSGSQPCNLGSGDMIEDMEAYLESLPKPMVFAEALFRPFEDAKDRRVRIVEGYDSFWCGCQEGMVGTQHCPVHGDKPTLPPPRHCECLKPNINSLSNGTCETCYKPVIRDGGHGSS